MKEKRNLEWKADNDQYIINLSEGLTVSFKQATNDKNQVFYNLVLIFEEEKRTINFTYCSDNEHLEVTPLIDSIVMIYSGDMMNAKGMPVKMKNKLTELLLNISKKYF